jgi:hypothetical protein
LNEGEKLMQFQIIGPDGFPALTVDGTAPLPGHQAISGASALLFDTGKWDDVDTGPAEVRAFADGLSDTEYAQEHQGKGFQFNCMGNGSALTPRPEWDIPPAQ